MDRLTKQDYEAIEREAFCLADKSMRGRITNKRLFVKLMTTSVRIALDHMYSEIYGGSVAATGDDQ